MFPRALYTAPLWSPDDPAGASAGDDDGKGDDDGPKLKDAPAGGERGILDHLDDGKGGDDDKKGDDDGKGDDGDKKGTKPDYIADNFWDADKGEVKLEELAKSQKDLRQKITKGDDKAPANAEDYKLEIPDDLKQTEARALIDGQDDPLVRWFRALAVEEKFSEATAAKLYSGFLRVAGDLMPAPIDPKVVVKNLGENGLGILKDTKVFSDNLLKLGVLNELEHGAMMSWFQDETDIRAFQKMREFYGEKAPPMAATIPSGTQSRAELRAKLATVTEKAEKGDPTAQAEYDKLQAEYTKTYGEEPAGTSLPG